MKRLITTLAIGLGLVLAQASSALAAVPRYWQVNMYDPAASSVSRSLVVAYQVQSTYQGEEGETDNSFDIKLMQNGSEVAAQSVTTPGGDSGSFTVTLPTTGTYSFKVVASNNVAGETKESATKTVQIVDGPAPNVVTVASTSSGGGGSGSGSVAGDVDGDGVVDDTNGDGVLSEDESKAANDRRLAAAAAAAAAVKAARDADGDGQPDDEESQSEEENKDEDDDSSAGWYVASGIAVLGGAAYYVFRVRRPGKD